MNASSRSISDMTVPPEVQVALHGLAQRWKLVEVEEVRRRTVADARAGIDKTSSANKSDAAGGEWRRRLCFEVLLEPRSFALSLVVRAHSKAFDVERIVIERSLFRRGSIVNRRLYGLGADDDDDSDVDEELEHYERYGRFREDARFAEVPEFETVFGELHEDDDDEMEDVVRTTSSVSMEAVAAALTTSEGVAGENGDGGAEGDDGGDVQELEVETAAMRMDDEDDDEDDAQPSYASEKSALASSEASNASMLGEDSARAADANSVRSSAAGPSGRSPGAMRKRVIMVCRAAERVRISIEQVVDNPRAKKDKPSSARGDEGNTGLSSSTASNDVRRNAIALHVVGYARGANPTPNRLKAFLNASTNLAFHSATAGLEAPASFLVDRTEIDALTGLSLHNAKRFRQSGELLARASLNAWRVASKFPDLRMLDWSLSLRILSAYSFFQHDPLLPEATLALQQVAQYAPAPSAADSAVSAGNHVGSAAAHDALSVFPPMWELDPTQGPGDVDELGAKDDSFVLRESSSGARAVVTALHRPLALLLVRTLAHSHHPCVRLASIKLLDYLIEQVGCALGPQLSAIVEGVLWCYSGHLPLVSPTGDKSGSGGTKARGVRTAADSDRAHDDTTAGGHESASRIEGVLDQVIDSLCRLLPLLDMEVLHLLTSRTLFPLVTESLAVLGTHAGGVAASNSTSGGGGGNAGGEQSSGMTRLHRRSIAQALRVLALVLKLTKGDVTVPPEFVSRLFRLLVLSRSVHHAATAAFVDSLVDDDAAVLNKYLMNRDTRRAAILAWESVHSAVAIASRGLHAARCQQYLELFSGMLTELFSETRRSGYFDHYDEPAANSTSPDERANDSESQPSIATTEAAVVEMESASQLIRDQLETKVQVRDMAALQRLVRFITDFVQMLEPVKEGDSVAAILAVFELQRTLSRVISRLCMSLMLDIALYEAKTSSRMADESSGFARMSGNVEDDVIDIGFQGSAPRKDVPGADASMAGGASENSSYDLQLEAALNLIDSVWQCHSLVAGLLPNDINLDEELQNRDGHGLGPRKPSTSSAATPSATASATSADPIDASIPGEAVLQVVVERICHRSPPPSLLRMLVIMVRRMSANALPRSRALTVSVAASTGGSVSGSAKSASASFSIKGKLRVRDLFIKLLRTLVLWVPHALNEETFDLLDELLRVSLSGLTVRDMLDLIDVLTDQSMSLHVQRVDASLRLLAELVATEVPLDFATAILSMKELERDSRRGPHTITGSLYDFIFSLENGQLRRRIYSSFPSSGFGAYSSGGVGGDDAGGAMSAGRSFRAKQSGAGGGRDKTGFESFFLHTVVSSCFDYFDVLCACGGGSANALGFRALAVKLDHFIEHAAFCVRCLKAACLPESAVDHRDYVSASLGDVFSTCLAMQEHLDARARLVGFEIFTAAIEVLLLSSSMRLMPADASAMGVHGTLANGGGAYSTDGDTVDLPLPRGRARFVHDATVGLQFEDKGWNMLTMFLVSSFAQEGKADLDLQYAAVRYVRNALLRALMGLAGGSGAGAISFEHILQLWDSIARIETSPWRELSLQSNIVVLIIVNVALYALFAARGRSQQTSRMSAMEDFVEERLFPWIEARLKGRSRQLRFWGARVLESYLRGGELNPSRALSTRLPNPPLRVWRALRALRQDWYVDLALLGDSLLEFYWNSSAGAGGEGSRESGTRRSATQPALAHESSTNVDNGGTALIELWFPDVAEEALGDVVQDEEQYSLSFAQFIDTYISGEDEDDTAAENRVQSLQDGDESFVELSNGEDVGIVADGSDSVDFDGDVQHLQQPQQFDEEDVTRVEPHEYLEAGEEGGAVGGGLDQKEAEGEFHEARGEEISSTARPPDAHGGDGGESESSKRRPRKPPINILINAEETPMDGFEDEIHELPVAAPASASAFHNDA